MLIDWFTVAAQIVNFLVLVGLMKRFLYGPLLHAIDAREQRIAAQLAEADNKTKVAERKTDEVRRQLADLDNRCGQIIEDARQDAGRQRADMVQAARDQVRALDARWRDDLRREEAAFFEEIRRAAATEILAIARRALTDLAGADLQRGAVLAFLERVKSFDAAALRKLCAGAGISVVSAAELSPDLRRQVEQSIENRTGFAVAPRYEIAPELGWGVELRGEGQRIGWTPGVYLDALEDKLRTALEARAEAGYPVAAA